MDESSILTAALSALESGLCPIRARADGSKAPLGEWKRWQSERPDEADVRSWFSNWPNLGLVTGAISDRLVLLEFEGRAMEMLPMVRLRLEQAGLWELFESWVLGYSELTPTGGLHVLIHLGGDEPLAGNTKLASNESGETLIETRGEGGFVITAPSNGDTHPSGKAWRLRSGGFETIAWVQPDEWLAVCEIMRLFDAAPPVPAVVVPPARLEGVLARDGWIDDALTKLPRMGVVLEANGWTYLETDHTGHQLWCRPGKHPMGTSASVNANDRLFVFSSNAHPLPPSEDRRTFDVLDVLCCYENGHLPTTDERVRYLAYYSGRPSPPATPDRGRAPKLSSDACHLPQDFWESRPIFDQIMVAARSRRVSPDAVLAAVMARVAACSPHTIRLPPLIGGSVPLSYLTLLVGPPETGKSAASRVAQELIPPIANMADGLPVGTGEGFVDILFRMVTEPDPDSGKPVKVRRQTMFNAYSYIDEGAALTATSSRSGTTIMSTLRTIFTGGILGNTLADAEKRRIIPAGGAVYGVVVAVQPEVAAGLLTMGEILAGTPQRFTFTSALDPVAPLDVPSWPGQLAWEPPRATSMELTAGRFGEMTVTSRIAKEIHSYHHATQQGAKRDRLDAHLLLRQEKAAGIFAILEGRLDIHDDDWELASQLMVTSNAVRSVVQARIHESTEEADAQADDRVVRRQVRVASGVERSEIEEAMETVVRMISKHPDGARRNQLRRDAGTRTKRNLDAALALGIERGRIEVLIEPGRGDDKRRFRIPR